MARISKHQLQRDTVAIVGDGQTERIYFSDVRDTDRPANLSIFPDYPRRIGNYKGVLDRAGSLVGNYNRIYALVDVDKIIQDQKQTAYARDKTAAEAAGIIVLENNPCFEMWLLLHFMHTGRLFTGCNEVIAQLRGNGKIPDYEKSEKFLRNARLYKNYKSRLIEKAIPNVKRLENNRADRDVLYPRAEIFRVLNGILGIGNNIILFSYMPDKSAKHSAEVCRDWHPQRMHRRRRGSVFIQFYRLCPKTQTSLAFGMVTFISGGKTYVTLSLKPIMLTTAPVKGSANAH